MTRAAAELAESLRASGARRDRVSRPRQERRQDDGSDGACSPRCTGPGIVAGATSAGRDGEEFDAITGEPKPRFRLWPGQLVASAASTFESAAFPVAELATLPFPTRFGPVQLRRAEAEGEIEVIGPSTASQLARTAAALEAAGAEIVLLDGAFGRRAFAAGRVCRRHRALRRHVRRRNPPGRPRRGGLRPSSSSACAPPEEARRGRTSRGP